MDGGICNFRSSYRRSAEPLSWRLDHIDPGKRVRAGVKVVVLVESGIQEVGVISCLHWHRGVWGGVCRAAL